MIAEFYACTGNAYLHKLDKTTKLPAETAKRNLMSFLFGAHVKLVLQAAAASRAKFTH
jgi:hypothetical protein